MLQDVIKNVHAFIFMLSIHYSCHILIKLKFSSDLNKNTEISNFMKLCSMGAELLHAARQDMMTLTGAFRILQMHIKMIL
jgi:hypothetical protein